MKKPTIWQLDNRMVGMSVWVSESCPSVSCHMALTNMLLFCSSDCRKLHYPSKHACTFLYLFCQQMLVHWGWSYLSFAMQLGPKYILVMLLLLYFLSISGSLECVSGLSGSYGQYFFISLQIANMLKEIYKQKQVLVPKANSDQSPPFKLSGQERQAATTCFVPWALTHCTFFLECSCSISRWIWVTGRYFRFVFSFCYWYITRPEMRGMSQTQNRVPL